MESPNPILDFAIHAAICNNNMMAWGFGNRQGAKELLDEKGYEECTEKGKDLAPHKDRLYSFSKKEERKGMMLTGQWTRRKRWEEDGETRTVITIIDEYDWNTYVCHYFLGSSAFPTPFKKEDCAVCATLKDAVLRMEGKCHPMFWGTLVKKAQASSMERGS